jgi:hypothetical protein
MSSGSISGGAAKKRPRGKPFQKGQSGNPAGRRKNTQEDIDVKVLAKAHTRDAIDTLTRIMMTGAERNQVRAAEVILSRGHGSPDQKIDVNLGLQQYDEAVQRAHDILGR